MSMLWRDNIQSLQVDVTSYCNAKCGGCARNDDGHETRPGLILENFDVDVWNRMAEHDTKDIFINELVLNGNWGDSMMHPKIKDMVTTFAKFHPEASLYIHTNGSMRTTKFWASFAKVCRQFSNHRVVFAVDGLEDTHAIYRRNTDFLKIMENIKAFTDANGRASVTMTLFEHNKHQVEEVKKIAQSLNADFTLRYSHGDGLEVIAPGENYMIYACDELPEEEVEVEHDNYRLSDLPNYMDNLIISDAIEPVASTCPWLADRQVQIDPWGTVWPCCHISNHANSFSSEYTGIAATDDNFDEGKLANNLKHTPLYDILSNRWYADVLPDAVKHEKWLVCRDSCFSD